MKKHVCFFLNSINFGGSEQYLYSLADDLNEKGFDISFVSSGGKMSGRLKEKGFNIVKLPICYISEHTIEKHSWKHRVILRNWFFLKFFYRAYLYFKVKNVDFVVSQHGFPSIVASDYSRRNTCKFLNVVHHILPNEYTDLYNVFNVTPDIYICISPEIKTFLKEKKLISNSIVINNPIAVPELKLDLSKNKFITLLSHVHLEKENSLNTFLKASKEPLLSNYIFRVVGDCSTEFAKGLVKSYPEVLFTGAVDRISALSYVHNSDVVVGIGRSAIESAMLGKKTIICGHIIGELGGNYGGILTKESYNVIYGHNFSGRHSYIESNVELLVTDILDCLSNDMKFNPPPLEYFDSYRPDSVLKLYMNVFDDLT
jgi:glycosyltransferase involved in cell wall biosynthesis